jgi:sigma-E factor negative regulatory protein RseC
MADIQSPRGTVISVQQNASGGRALVEVDAQEICPRCREGKGCGAGIFGASRAERRIDALLLPGSTVRKGDLVNLSLGSRNLLQAATIVYGWPLLGGASVALLAYLAGLGDVGGALAALVGLLAGAVLVRRKLGQGDCLSRFVPTVIDGPEQVR